MIARTTQFDDEPVVVQFLPSNRSHLEDYACALLAAGHSRELIDDVIIGLLWSSMFLGEKE